MSFKTSITSDAVCPNLHNANAVPMHFVYPELSDRAARIPVNPPVADLLTNRPIGVRDVARRIWLTALNVSSQAPVPFSRSGFGDEPQKFFIWKATVWALVARSAAAIAG
eukprot:5327123-Lingulodinium_polyedra.AAC.1